MDLVLDRGTVASGGEDIYWELASTGADDERPVVVLSHGAGGSHAVWFQQVPHFGLDHRVVTWDSRGFGNSSNRTGALRAEAAADDLAAVLDHLGIERAHLIGQSLGGWHSTAFTMSRPDRVVSLVLADTIGGLWTDELRQAMAAFQQRGGLVGGGPEVIGAHPALWAETRRADPALAFLYQALGSFHTPPMDQLGPTVGWSTSHDDLAGLGIPVLVVAGVHDDLFPSPALRQSAELAGAQFVEIGDAGHSPYFEQPARWNDAVGAFIRSVNR